MRLLILLFILITSISFGQMANKAVYNWDFVMKRVRNNKMSVSAGTKEIISEITTTYDAENEQKELIEFYKNTYDFKVVDKTILKNLIDSLVDNGLNEEIKSFATEARYSVEFRFLNRKINDFSFPDKNGKQIKLTSLNDKIVIVELWATWCRPCVKEMSRIPRLREINPKIEFYSISLDKSLDRMIKFVNKNEYDWPIVFGGDEHLNKELWDYLNIVAIPKYYVIERSGTIIHIADKLDEQFINNLR